MIKKFIHFSIGNFISLLLGIITSPIITRIIGPNEMGKFTIFNTTTSLIFLFVMLGTDQSYVRFYNTVDENGKVTLLRHIIKISFIVATVTSFIIFLSYKQVSLYIYGSPSFSITIFLVVNVYISIFQRFSILEVRMSLKAKLFSLLNIIQKLSYVLLVFFLYLFLSNDSRVLVIATIVSSLICSILCIFIERKVLFARIKPTSNLNLLKLMKYGFPYIFSNALTWILEYMDKITIRKYCNFNEVGIYSAAGTIVALLTTCQLAFSTFWVPTAYKKYEEDSNSAVYFIKVNRIISFIMIVLGLCLVTSKDIIIYILGSEYRNSVFVFPFLSFMPIMFTISETTVMGINFTQKSYFHIVIAFIAAICNFIGNINLVPIYGAKGAAISTGFSYIVLFVARTYFSIKCYKCDYNIKTIVIPVTMLSVLSIYSSFNKFNLNIAVGSLLSIALTIYLYKDVVFEIIHLILKMYHSRISLYKIKKM